MKMSNRGGWPLVLVAFMLSVSCTEPALDRSEQSEGSPVGGVLVSDRESLLRAELEQADRRFASEVRERGLDAWVEAFAADGAVLPAEGPIASGPEAIRALFEPVFADPAFVFTWDPVRVEVSSSGDLGYTFGIWESASTERGQTLRASGKYATIWRRDEGGTWRVLLDIGNTRPGREAGRGAAVGGN